jgi:hypothetical protein
MRSAFVAELSDHPSQVPHAQAVRAILEQYEQGNTMLVVPDRKAAFSSDGKCGRSPGNRAVRFRTFFW